jgi:hypothetical protein
MSGTQTVPVLQAPSIIKTTLTPPAAIKTVIVVGQGPKGDSADNFSADPLAYYILAKS